MTKREAELHLVTACDHLLAAAPRLDGERHLVLLRAIGAVRTVRRELIVPRKRKANGLTR